MSGQKKTSLTRIRTYAQDLDVQRKKTAPPDAKTEVHTVVAEPVIVSKPKPLAPTYTPNVTPVESKTIFPPQEPFEKIETPLHELEKSFTPPTQSTTPTHIPAFHELQQELENSINPKKPDTSAFSKPYDTPVPTKTPQKTKPTIKAKDPIALSGGTVITDTKRTDFSFLSAIISSVTEFFHSLSEQFNKPKAPPKYTVAVPERRKGVIQKATSKTGTIFTADNETLKEEILRRRREQAAKPEISWSANTEVGYPLLEAPEPSITNVVVTYKHETALRLTKPQPVITPTPVAEDERRWSEPARVEPPTPRIVVPPPTPEPIPLPAIEPLPEPVVVPSPLFETAPLREVTPAPVSPPTPSAKPKIKRSWFSGIRSSLTATKDQYTSLSTVNSNVVALTIVGIIIGVVVVGVTTRSLIALLSSESGTPVASEMKAPLIVADRNGTILFTPGSVNSVEQIITAGVSTTGAGITEIRFLDTNQVELSPQTLFTLFGFQTNPNFNQSVSTLRLLSLDGQNRGFLFEVTDATTVFGAMLEWESEMYSDLGELLNLPVTRPENARYIDRTIGQSDVRILVVDGQEILMYGFIDNDLLLITTDSTQFNRILQAR